MGTMKWGTMISNSKIFFKINNCNNIKLVNKKCLLSSYFYI